MIFVTDRGQMCNNIYQYIQMYAWGRENNRHTMSMRFAHKYPHFAIKNTKYENVFVYIFVKIISMFHLIPVIDFDKCTSREDGINKIMNSYNCIVKGWSWIRFPELMSKYQKEMADLFAFDENTRRNVKDTMNNSADINIGIHIRRGDYKTFKNGKLYFDDEEFISYMNKAISIFGYEKKICFYICTNDMNLDRKRYRQELKADIMFSQGTGIEDLCLLSECDYIIGPASSYSLIATLYGKARLYWMNHRESVHDMNTEKFKDFCSLVWIFDKQFD